MSNVIYIMGKSSAGKDTVYQRLKDKIDTSTYVPYTTRPKRVGEQDGREYYFIDREDFKNFEKQDIHIHVPEGAIKKDGPSAGVTLTTAIYSAFSNKPVRSDVAMTGEITLRGKVLPIGGLKEKSISAHRSGIRTIIIPKENEKDIDDIPEQVRSELTIVLASHIDTVLDNAICK